MTRYFQQQMVGGLPTIATDAVTTCRTYTKLLEVCNKIKDVLESNDIDAEQKNEQILELLSTINEDSEWNSPYDCDRPDDGSWTENTEEHLRNTFELARETLCEAPDSNLVFFMEAEYFKHMSDNFFKEYFTIPPISLFDKNPHDFSARLYRVKVGQVVIDDVAQDQYINMIVMDCSFFTPYAIQSSSSANTRIKSSASLVAVTHVLAEAGIVSSEVLSKMHGLNLTFGIGVEGRFTDGTVSNPTGVVEQACHLVLPRNYGVNQYEPGVQEVANEIMRSSGDKHSLDSRKLHKLYVVAIVQILGVGLVGNWLRNIHNNTVSLSDPKVFLQSMQQQGIENERLRKRLKRQEERVELDTLEQLVAVNDVQRARLEVLRSTKEADRLRRQTNSAKKRKSEYDRLRKQEKRQKRVEEAEKHPMLKLLVSSNKNCPPKLIAIINDGTLKKVLTSYFVPQQKMKLSDKFINTVDGCEGVTRFLAVSCLDNHIPDLSTMKNSISSKTPDSFKI
jgi:hypothetical protein